MQSMALTFAFIGKFVEVPMYVVTILLNIVAKCLIGVCLRRGSIFTPPTL